MARRIISSALALLALGGAALFLWPVPMHAASDLTALKVDTARGAYVARLGGCFACHTDAKGGGAILAGGPPLNTPFGVFYAPNITMHETDGIGDWSIEDFDRAMRSGVSPKGDHYFPAFPYGHYTKTSPICGQPFKRCRRWPIAPLSTSCPFPSINVSCFVHGRPCSSIPRSWRVTPNARPSGTADGISQKDQAIAVHVIPPETCSAVNAERPRSQGPSMRMARKFQPSRQATLQRQVMGSPTLLLLSRRASPPRAMYWEAQ